jgi:hypothetical protein
MDGAAQVDIDLAAVAQAGGWKSTRMPLATSLWQTGVASSAASNFSQSPVCLSRKVGVPLSAETPAPVKTTRRAAARKAWIILLPRLINWIVRPKSNRS